MFLTAEDGLILGPICWLFGNIFELIYKFVELITKAIGFNYVNLTVCVILFTFFIRACLFPLNFKQQKSSKIMSFIQPEIKKATKKYNGKTDQESLMKKNQETQKIQKKYGVSLTSGCLPTLIQLPVFYGLYRVIQNIPVYVSDMLIKYQEVLGYIKTAAPNNYYEMINKIAIDNEGAVSTASQYASIMMKNAGNGIPSDNSVIDVLDKMSSTDWHQVMDAFNFGSNTDAVNSAVQQFNNMNNCFGLNITDAPGWKLSFALIIPILAALFQFISSKYSMAANNAVMNNASDPQTAQSAGMMKSMTYMMPIMSLFFCINLPIAIGIYWILGAIITLITQMIINHHYNNCDVEELLKKCETKAALKEAKRKAKHPNKKSFYEKMMDAQNGNVSAEGDQAQTINRNASTRLKNYVNSASSAENEALNNRGNVKYKQGSIGSKANIMLQYGDKKSNDNGGKK